MKTRWIQLDGKKIREYREKLIAENGTNLNREEFIEELMERVFASEKLADTRPDFIRRIMKKTEDGAFAISVGTLLQIENDQRKVSEETAEFLAAGMEVDIKELIKSDNRGRDAMVSEYDLEFPVPTMFSKNMLAIPDTPDNCPTSIILKEIVAIHQPTRGLTVLGYGDLTEESLFILMAHWVGGGFDALMEWGGIGENDSFVFDSTMGLAIGSQSEDSPKLIIGFSGCEIRFEFTHPRSQSGLV